MFSIIHSLGYLDVMERKYQAQPALDFGLASSLKNSHWEKKYLKNPVFTLEIICHFNQTLPPLVCDIYPERLCFENTTLSHHQTQAEKLGKVYTF